MEHGNRSDVTLCSENIHGYASERVSQSSIHIYSALVCTIPRCGDGSGLLNNQGVVMGVVFLITKVW